MINSITWNFEQLLSPTLFDYNYSVNCEQHKIDENFTEAGFCVLQFIYGDVYNIEYINSWAVYFSGD